MRNKLLSLMPEFQLIEDAELQEKTIVVWSWRRRFPSGSQMGVLY